MQPGHQAAVPFLLGRGRPHRGTRPRKAVPAVSRAPDTVVTRLVAGDAAAAVRTAPRAPDAVETSPGAELQLSFFPANGGPSVAMSRAWEVVVVSTRAPDAVITTSAAGDTSAAVATSLGAGVVGPDTRGHRRAAREAGDGSAMTLRAREVAAGLPRAPNVVVTSAASAGGVSPVVTRPGAGVVGPYAGGQLASTPDAEDGSAMTPHASNVSANSPRAPAAVVVGAAFLPTDSVAKPVRVPGHVQKTSFSLFFWTNGPRGLCPGWTLPTSTINAEIKG